MYCRIFEENVNEYCDLHAGTQCSQQIFNSIIDFVCCAVKAEFALTLSTLFVNDHKAISFFSVFPHLLGSYFT